MLLGRAKKKINLTFIHTHFTNSMEYIYVDSVFSAFTDNKQISKLICQMVVGAKEKKKAKGKGW